MSVTFKIYASDGTTPVYTLPVVFDANYPYSASKIIEHENVRSKGSIVINGGEQSWDLNLKGVVMAADYDALMTIVNAIESAIVINTPYYIKISSGTTTHSYKCKRITPIEWQNDSLRTKYIEYAISLRINCW
jgi:hypothetical protein